MVRAVAKSPNATIGGAIVKTPANPNTMIADKNNRNDTKRIGQSTLVPQEPLLPPPSPEGRQISNDEAMKDTVASRGEVQERDQAPSPPVSPLTSPRCVTKGVMETTLRLVKEERKLRNERKQNKSVLNIDTARSVDKEPCSVNIAANSNKSARAKTTKKANPKTKTVGQLIAKALEASVSATILKEKEKAMREAKARRKRIEQIAQEKEEARRKQAAEKKAAEAEAKRVEEEKEAMRHLEAVEKLGAERAREAMISEALVAATSEGRSSSAEFSQVMGNKRALMNALKEEAERRRQRIKNLRAKKKGIGVPTDQIKSSTSTTPRSLGKAPASEVMEQGTGLPIMLGAPLQDHESIATVPTSNLSSAGAGEQEEARHHEAAEKLAEQADAESIGEEKEEARRQEADKKGAAEADATTVAKNIEAKGLGATAADAATVVVNKTDSSTKECIALPSTLTLDEGRQTSKHDEEVRDRDASTGTGEEEERDQPPSAPVSLPTSPRLLEKGVMEDAVLLVKEERTRRTERKQKQSTLSNDNIAASSNQPAPTKTTKPAVHVANTNPKQEKIDKALEASVATTILKEKAMREANARRVKQEKAAAAEKNSRRAAAAIQAFARGTMARIKYAAVIRAAVRLQALARSNTAKMKYLSITMSIVKLQTRARRLAAQRRYQAARQVAISSQCYARQSQARRHYLASTNAVVLLQATARMTSTRKSYSAIRSEKAEQESKECIALPSTLTLDEGRQTSNHDEEVKDRDASTGTGEEEERDQPPSAPVSLPTSPRLLEKGVMEDAVLLVKEERTRRTERKQKQSTLSNDNIAASSNQPAPTKTTKPAVHVANTNPKQEKIDKALEASVATTILKEKAMREANARRVKQEKAAAAEKNSRRAAAAIQAFARGTMARIKYAAVIRAAVRLQALARSNTAKMKYLSITMSIVKLQTRARRLAAQRRYQAARQVAISSQCYARQSQARRHYLASTNAVVLLQATARMTSTRKSYSAIRSEKAEQESIEAERIAAEEKAKQEHVAAERAEQERHETERVASERAEQERLEQERIEAELTAAVAEAEAKRIKVETLKAETKQRKEQEQQRKAELKRSAAEKKAKEEEERRTAVEKGEQEHIKAERIAAEEKSTQERMAAEKADQDSAAEAKRIAQILEKLRRQKGTEKPPAEVEAKPIAQNQEELCRQEATHELAAVVMAKAKRRAQKKKELPCHKATEKAAAEAEAKRIARKQEEFRRQKAAQKYAAEVKAEAKRTAQQQQEARRKEVAQELTAAAQAKTKRISDEKAIAERAAEVKTKRQKEVIAAAAADLGEARAEVMTLIAKAEQGEKPAKKKASGSPEEWLAGQITTDNSKPQNERKPSPTWFKLPADMSKLPSDGAFFVEEWKQALLAPKAQRSSTVDDMTKVGHVALREASDYNVYCSALKQKCRCDSLFVQGLINELIRFLALKIFVHGLPHPSPDIEKAWSALMLFPQTYSEVCKAMGSLEAIPFHDVSVFNLSRDAKKERYSLTLSTYSALFNEEPPSEIWWSITDDIQDDYSSDGSYLSDDNAISLPKMFSVKFSKDRNIISEIGSTIAEWAYWGDD